MSVFRVRRLETNSIYCFQFSSFLFSEPEYRREGDKVRSRIKKFFFAITTGALAAVVGWFIISTFTGSGGVAQTNQMQGGSGNIGNFQFENNSGTVNNITNTGEINIIFNDASRALQSEAQIANLDEFRSVLLRLERSGDLRISKDGIEEIANIAVALLTKQQLTRDVITDRQFSLKKDQTHSIAGSRNRLTYKGILCGGLRVDHIAIVLNGVKDDCVGPGESKIFEEGDKFYEIVYDGFNHSVGEAEFSIYPIPVEEYEYYTPIKDSEYGQIFRWNRATYDCRSTFVERHGQWFCGSRPEKR